MKNMIAVPQCFNCKHYLDKYSCGAFPEKGTIPDKILLNEFDHREKHPDQNNDITFEEKENTENAE